MCTWILLERRRRVDMTAMLLFRNSLVSSSLRWKMLKDRYKSLQNQFEMNRKDKESLSGVRGSKMGDLLLTMGEARDVMAARNAHRRIKE